MKMKEKYDSTPSCFEMGNWAGEYNLWGRFTDETLEQFYKTDFHSLRLRAGDWCDLSPLIEKKGALNKLVIMSTVVDWSAISELTELEQLLMSDNIGSKIQYADLKGLKALHCYGGDKYFDQVYDMENLEYLRVAGFREVDFAKLARMKSLKKLELIDAHKLASFDGLENINALQALELDGAPKLERVDALNSPHNLKMLELTNCKRLVFPEQLLGLGALKYLGLCKVPNITSLKPFRTCNGIEIITIFDLSVKDGDLSFLLELANLKKVIIQAKRHYNIDVDELEERLSQKYGDVDFTSLDWFDFKQEYFGYHNPWDGADN
jgi:hypothetical protein